MHACAQADPEVVAAMAARRGMITHGVGTAGIDEQIAFGYLQVLGHMPQGHMSLVFGLWSLVFGLRSSVFGLWSLVFGLWSLVVGRWSLVLGHRL